MQMYAKSYIYQLSPASENYFEKNARLFWR